MVGVVGARTKGRTGAIALALLAFWGVEGVAKAESKSDPLLREARSSFARRAKTAEALKAVTLFGEAIAAGGGYAAMWEGARASFYYGYFALPKRERGKRLAVLERGAVWAEQATKVRPDGAEGHFYRASLLGGWGEVRGLAGALVVAGDIRRAGEKALALDRSVECAGPLRLMGRYYFKLPGAFGGSNEKSLSYLEEALRICPIHPQVHIYLAETLHAEGQVERARERAQWVLDNPRAGIEYRQFRADAEALLERI